MKRIIKAVAIAMILTAGLLNSGCSHQLMSFSNIATQHPSVKYGSKGPYVAGKGGTMDAAVNDALAKAGAGYDMLIDGKVTMYHYNFVIMWVAKFKVEGTAVKSEEVTNGFNDAQLREWNEKHHPISIKH